MGDFADTGGAAYLAPDVWLFRPADPYAMLSAKQERPLTMYKVVELNLSHAKTGKL